jgi:hypothetical protein
MASHDSDPEEFVGRDRSIPAAPKGKRTAPAATGILNSPVDPAPRVTPYTPPAPGAPHPSHAVLGPALRLDKAEAAVTATALELSSSYNNLRQCERVESIALLNFTKVMPSPTFDQINRARLAAEQAARAQRVAAGQNPDAVAAPVVVNKSPLDQHAMARGKAAARSGVPLVSNVVRGG